MTWSIKSGGEISGSRSMDEVFLPLPEGWELTGSDGLNLSDRQAFAEVGHIHPDPPEFRTDPDLALVSRSLFEQTRKMMDRLRRSKHSRYDYICDISVIAFPGREEARKHAENRMIPFKEGGLDSVLEAAARLNPEAAEKIKEAQKALSKVPDALMDRGVSVSGGRFLGEEAVFTAGPGGRIPSAVIINNFLLSGTILGAGEINPGSVKIHSIECRKAKKNHKSGCGCSLCLVHPPCSTRANENLIHREEAEGLLKLLFARLRADNRGREDSPGFTVERKGSRVENPGEGAGLQKEDIIKTGSSEVSITDELDNLVCIAPGSELKVEDEALLEQVQGELRAKIRKFPRGRDFSIRNPVAVLGVRGTEFSLRMEQGISELKVFEGEVEFSDLKGGSVTVREGQGCRCSAEGLRKPF